MAWFKNLSVGAKLFASFATLLALTIIMGTVTIRKMSDLNKGVSQLTTQSMPSTNAANAANTAVSDYRIKEFRHIVDTKPEGMAFAERSMADLSASIDKHREEMTRLFASPEEKKKLEELSAAWDEYMATSQKIVVLSRDMKKDEAVDMLIGTIGLYNRVNSLLSSIVETTVKYGEAEGVKAEASYLLGRNIALIALAITIVIGLILAYWISSWFTKAIIAVDEISTAVAAASQQLAAAAEQLSSGAQQSASSLEETASSLEEMTATVKQNADNADQANQLANTSRGTAEQGGEVVASAVTAMAEINQASKKIADIITTIDEIAFQTNLLALNAAVEAARAGEQGRGFAVVAGEVRNLAQRSATAAREIKGLIQDSVQKVETGSALVNRSGDTLSAIVASVKKVTDIVAEIAAASREQSAGIEQINKAVAQMDQVTQSNASQTEEMSGTAVALSGQAEHLQAVVAQFNINKSAEQRPTAASRAISSEVARPAKNGKQVRKAKPKAAKPVERELELVGAGAGEFSGFEEF